MKRSYMKKRKHLLLSSAFFLFSSLTFPCRTFAACSSMNDLGSLSAGDCEVEANTIGSTGAQGIAFSGTPNTISGPHTYTLTGSLYQTGSHGISVAMTGAEPPVIQFNGGALWDISSYYTPSADITFTPTNSLGMPLNEGPVVGDITIQNGYFNGPVKIYKGDTKTFFTYIKDGNTIQVPISSLGNINIYGGKFFFNGGDSEIRVMGTTASSQTSGVINLYDPSMYVGYVLNASNPDAPTLDASPSTTRIGSLGYQLNVNGGAYTIAEGSILNFAGSDVVIDSASTGFRPTTFSGAGMLSLSSSSGGAVTVNDAITWDEGTIEIDTGNIIFNNNVTVNELLFYGDNGATLSIAPETARLTVRENFNMYSTTKLTGAGELYLYSGASATFGMLDFGTIRIDSGTVRFTGSSTLTKLVGGAGDIYINAPLNVINLEMGTADFFINEGLNVTNIDFGTGGTIKFTANKSITMRSDSTLLNTKNVDTTSSQGTITVDAGKSLTFADAEGNNSVFVSRGLNLEAKEGSIFNFNGTGVELNNVTLKRGTANFNNGASVLSSLTAGDTGTAGTSQAFINVAQGANVTVGNILALVGSESVINGTLSASSIQTNGSPTTWAAFSGTGRLIVTGTANFGGWFNGLNNVVIDASSALSDVTANFNGYTGNDKISVLTLQSGSSAQAVANLSQNLTLDSLIFDPVSGGIVNIGAGATLAIRQTSDISGANALKNIIKGDGTLQLLDNTSINFGGGSEYLGGLKIGTGTATITENATLGTVTFSSAEGGALVINSGKLLEINSDVITAGTNSITGGGTLQLVGNANGHFGASIEGLGKLEIGNGTATFSVNSSLGNVTFTAGSTGKIEIAQATTISLSNSLNLATSNAIMGAGTLHLAGASNATLNTGSDTLGNLLIGSGTAAFNANSQIGNINFSGAAGGVSIAGGTTLTVTQNLNTVAGNSVSGAGTLLIGDGAQANLNSDLNSLSALSIGSGANVRFNADSTLQNVGFASGNGGMITIAGGKTLSLANGITTSGTNNIVGDGTLYLAAGKTGQFNSSITGLGNLKIADGAAAAFGEESTVGNLFFESTSGGGVTIADGKVLHIGNSAVFGTANTLGGTGTLDLAGGASAVFGTVSSFGGTIRVGTGEALFAQDMTVASLGFASDAGGTIRIDAGKELVVSDGITTSGTNNITGGGVLTLGSASNGTFGAVISALGALNIGNGTASFMADASLNSLNFMTNNGTVNIAGGRTVTVFSDFRTQVNNVLGGDGRLQLGGASNGTFGAAIAGLGGLTIGTGTASINEDASIGSVSFASSEGGALNIAANKTLNLGSTLYTNGANALAGTGTIAMAGNAGTVFNTALNFDGTLTMNAGTARFNTSGFVNTVNINSGGTLDADVSRVRANTVNLNEGSTLALRLRNTATDTSGNVRDGHFGVLEANTVNVNGASNLKVTIDYGTVTKEEGTEFKLIEGTVNNASNFTLRNNRYSFESVSCADGLCYNIIQTSNAGEAAGEAGGTQNNVNTAHGFLDGEFFAPGSEIARVAEHLDYLSQHSPREYTNALTALAPDVTGATTQLPLNVQNKIIGTLSSRLYNLQNSMGRVPAANYNIRGRSGGSPYEYRWMPSGDYYRKAGYTDEVIEPSLSRQKYQKASPSDADYPYASSEQRMKRRIMERRQKHFGLWAQGFFNTTEHISSSDPKGFSGDTTGVALGFDAEVWDGWVVGLGYAHTKTDTDALQRSIDMTANSGFLYSMYKPNRWFFSGVLSYSQGSSDEDKNLSGMTITDSYDTTSYALQMMAGYDYGGWRPAFGFRYASISQDAHQDSIGQQVGEVSNTMLSGVLEARFTKDILSKGNRYWRPELSLGITYDFTSDDNAAMVTLPNGSFYSVSGESLDKLAGEIGLSVAYLIGGHTDISLGYFGEFRKDYTSHTGMLSLRYNF